MDPVGFLASPQGLISVIVGIAAVATLLMFVGTSSKDPFKERMKSVAGEREKLRQMARAEAQAAAGGSKLRLQASSGAKSITELFNLGSIAEASAVRDKLKQAGLRTEKHVYTFVLSRLIGPPVLALVAAYYTTYKFTGYSLRVQLLVWAGAAVLGYLLPGIILSNKIQKRQDEIRRAWPDAMDVLLICVEAGMTLEPALNRVSKEMGGQSVALAEELGLTMAELSYLGDRRRAFENLSKRVPIAVVKSVTTAFIQAERYGTPLGQALRIISQEARDQRMQDAEKKAASLPSKLTVPMIVFFLPVVFVIILGPSVLRIFAQ